MNNELLQRYGFKVVNEENYVTKDLLLITSVVTINNCSVRGITMYYRGKIIREAFFIDEVNGKKNNKDLPEEQRNIWSSLEDRAKLGRFDRLSCEKLRTKEALDDLMEDLDTITSLLSIVIR